MALCGISSESSLFAKVPVLVFIGIQNKKMVNLFMISYLKYTIYGALSNRVDLHEKP